MHSVCQLELYRQESFTPVRSEFNDIFLGIGIRQLYLDDNPHRIHRAGNYLNHFDAVSDFKASHKLGGILPPAQRRFLTGCSTGAEDETILFYFHDENAELND